MRFPNVTLWRPAVSARCASGLLGLLLAGCAASGVRPAGTSGPLTWQATELRLQHTMLSDGQEYGFTLVLRETTGTALTLTSLAGSLQNSRQSWPVSWAKAGQWVVPAYGELRLPLSSYRYCPSASCRDLGTLEPYWEITLSGTDGHGHPVRYTLTLRLPASPA